jgi:hypothetical protein
VDSLEQGSAEFGSFELCGSFFNKRAAEFLEGETLRYLATRPRDVRAVKGHPYPSGEKCSEHSYELTSLLSLRFVLRPISQVIGGTRRTGRRKRFPFYRSHFRAFSALRTNFLVLP